MATIEDLEQSLISSDELADLELADLESAVTEFESDDDDDNLYYADVVAAMGWLRKCALLFDHMSDIHVCPVIDTRERDIMARLSDAVSQFVEDTKDTYENAEF